jgi:hypothetical protein
MLDEKTKCFSIETIKILMKFLIITLLIINDFLRVFIETNRSSLLEVKVRNTLHLLIYLYRRSHAVYSMIEKKIYEKMQRVSGFLVLYLLLKKKRSKIV